MPVILYSRSPVQMALRFAQRVVATTAPRFAQRPPTELCAFSQLPLRRCLSAPTDEPEPPAKIVALCDELCTLNVIEMNQLVTLFKVRASSLWASMRKQSCCWAVFKGSRQPSSH